MRTDIHAELSTFIIITSIPEISTTWFPSPHTHRIGALWMIGSRVQIDSCRDLVIFSCRVGCFDSSVELWRSDRCSNEAKVGVRAPGEHIPKMYLKSNTKMSALVSQNTNRHSSEFKFIVCIMILIANVGAEWSEDESILNLLYFSDFCIDRSCSNTWRCWYFLWSLTSVNADIPSEAGWTVSKERKLNSR